MCRRGLRAEDQHRMENVGPARRNRCRLAFEESLAWMAANGWNVEPV